MSKQTFKIEADHINSVIHAFSDELLFCAAQQNLSAWTQAINFAVMEAPGGDGRPLFAIGVGKSGNIAQKVAATLSSTGTPTVFLTPEDAFHGSLGLIHTGAIALCFSGSGETTELLDLLPHLKKRSVKIIAFVGKTDSTLAKAADALINCSIRREACPMNLAPTTSTLISLALADTFAICLMNAKGFSKEQFALNHPGGQLGKRLTLRVNDLMVRDLPFVEGSDLFIKVVEKMTQYAIGAVFVCSADKFVGIVTDGDLRRFVQKTPVDQLVGSTASAMMTTHPKTCSDMELAAEALRKMEFGSSQISILPVIRSGVALGGPPLRTDVVGVLKLHDLVKAGL